jgi:hypothetical protein
MRTIVLAAVISSLFVCGTANVAAAFVCPVKSLGANAAQDQAIAAVIAAGDGLANVTKLNAAIDVLRGQGIENAIIVDGLIAAYCPTVAGNAALSDAHKRAQVQGFAARVTRAVYSLDSVDAVILDVPFRPDVIDAINARAAAARVSPEAWVASTVEGALKGAR